MNEKKTVILGGREIAYKIRRSSGTRYAKLAVDRLGSVSVLLPTSLGEVFAQKFLLEKAAWVLEKVNYFEKRKESLSADSSHKSYIMNKAKAMKLAKERLAYFNQLYGFDYNKISIKNQTGRWGSCSTNGNINFNYKIAIMPPELADYVIVHELCHLGQMNHSPAFWKLVAKTIPDYKLRRKKIKEL